MKVRRIISFIMTILVIAMSVLPVCASDINKDNTQYVFPITPEDSEWETFTTKQEMLDVCQIPQAKLESMTTRALLETVLNYPLLLSYSAFNCTEDACNVMSNDFNGFKELLSRDDVSSVLLEKYSNTRVVMASEFENTPVEEFMLPSALEFLLACDEIENNNLTEEESLEVYHLVEEKMNAREEAGIYSTASEVYYNYLLEKDEISLFAGENNTPVTIRTPNGTKIPNVYSRSPEFTSQEISQTNSYYDKTWPRATRVGSATIKYNCHSYAWYQRSTSNPYWIDQGPANTYVNDGSYYKYTGTPRLGMIYYYNNGEHSGVSIGAKMVDGSQVHYARSKWGAAGLYEHAFSYCPYTISIVLYSK